MIALDDLGHTGRYGFKNGFLNIGWLTGWLRRSIPNQEPIPDVIWLQPPTNNLNLCLPIRLDGIKLPSSMRDTTPVQFIVRLEAEKISSNTPSVMARALYFDRPNILNMPAQIGWNSSIPAGVPVDDFMPLSATPEARMSDNMNVVRAAGIVIAKTLLPSKSRDSNHQILSMLIAQHADPAAALHVRVYGSQTETLFRRLPIGYPIMVKGTYMVKPEPILGAEPVDGIIPVRKYGYIKATDLKVAIRDDIPVGLPEWANQLVEKNDIKAAKANPQKARKPRKSVSAKANPQSASSSEVKDENPVPSIDEL